MIITAFRASLCHTYPQDPPKLFTRISFTAILVSPTTPTINMASSFGSGDPTLQREIRTSHSLTQKLARYRSHQNFLSTCYRNKWCPKGMCLKFAFSALPPSERLHQEIQCIIDRAQRSIVQVCCKYYQRTARHLQHQLTVVKTTLSESMRESQAEYQTLKGKWRSEEKRLWKSLQEVKKKKKCLHCFHKTDVLPLRPWVPQILHTTPRAFPHVVPTET